MNCLQESSNSTLSPAGSDFLEENKEFALSRISYLGQTDSTETPAFPASHSPRLVSPLLPRHPSLPPFPLPKFQHPLAQNSSVPLNPALIRDTSPLLPVTREVSRYPLSYERCIAKNQRDGALTSSQIPTADISKAPASMGRDIASNSSGYGSPVSTPLLFFGAEDENSNLESSDRPQKRVRIRSENVMRGFDDSAMPPPGIGPGSHLNLVSESGHGLYKPSRRSFPEAPDLRRLSVKSLLSGPLGMTGPRGNPLSLDWPGQNQDLSSDTVTWGIDRGFKDLDYGKNDDLNAISGSSPLLSRDHIEYTLEEISVSNPIEFGFGMETNTLSFASGSYYDKPVTIRIPRWYGELPTKLRQHPMNLLYFHHFINHTAGCLVPHNCSSNPFKSILPQMALQDDNLLNLLLAYSASHRARLLRQSEPAIRIALWVQDIFPNLRRALDDPNQILTNANLATAIMLASLEIISPKAFGVSVPWQNHLDTARQMITARGGAQYVQTASRGDKVMSFLWRWFAYLDVLGSLSGGKANASTLFWASEGDGNNEDEYQIDCILGFTSRCVRLLALVAELARVCDTERIGPDHEIITTWKPSDYIAERAHKLQKDLDASILHPSKPCTHMQSSGGAAYQWDSLEMTAINEAFHYAGLVHLHKRILGKGSKHPDVQNAVLEIFGALNKVRRGSSAEACLLFPMFTAGCDTRDEKKRIEILDRIKSMEMVGMTQIHKARNLMQKVWDTGKPWETLVAGEFFG